MLTAQPGSPPCRREDTRTPERDPPQEQVAEGQTVAAATMARVTDEERAAIIALCEDPAEDFRDVSGRPPTPEEVAMVESIADAMFFRRPPEGRIDDIVHLPAHVSARLLAQMPTADREYVLSCLPSHLSDDILSLLPVGTV